MISLNGIEKIVRKGNIILHALKGITLNIEQGEIFGIIGRAGAGKSALIRCINLLEPPSGGAVLVDSCDLMTLTTEGLRNARRNIGMIFQHFNLLASRSVFDNIALPLELNGTPKDQIESQVRPLLELTQLEDKANAYPHQLNNGQKQRVAIARALINQPKVLLCEEATASLDPKAKQSILKLLSLINQKLNLTIVLITHELEVIKSICNRVAVLHEGEIVEQTTVLDFYSHPTSLVGKEFIKTAARNDLPTALRNRMHPDYRKNSYPIARIAFRNSNSQQPFLAMIIQQYNLSVNIIQANTEIIHNHLIGIMVAEMVGEKEDIESALRFLEHKKLHVEVLGYASRTA